MQNTLKFFKTRIVKSPAYGTVGSAGIDFFVPDDFLGVELAPGEAVIIPSGIKARVPDGLALIAFNKSGKATKNHLQVGACVVDSDYQGEIHLHVYNTSKKFFTRIDSNDKLVQFILLPYITGDLVECDNIEDVFPTITVRGDGGFGHTDAIEATR
jgi:dUTP pyrophosphatase